MMPTYLFLDAVNAMATMAVIAKRTVRNRSTLLSTHWISPAAEGIKAGGIGSVFSEMMSEKGFKGNFNLTAVDNEFVKHAAVSALLSEYSLDENGMIKTILEYDDGGKKDEA